jgi:hypothetical protein
VWELFHGAANKLYAETITQAGSAEAAGHPRSAEHILRTLPGWAKHFASLTFRSGPRFQP